MRIEKKEFNKKFSNKIINNKINKKAALELSFGTIFSIILIVFFIFIAIIVINSFLDVQDCAKLGIFLDSFRSDITKSWNSQYDKHTFKSSLPGKLDYVCIANLSQPLEGKFKEVGKDLEFFEGKKANLFFVPRAKACEIPYHYIDHLDNEKIVSVNNPNCFPVENGNIILNVEKGLNDRFVNIR